MVFINNAIIWAMLLSVGNSSPNDTLTLTITNIDKPKGHILVALFDKEGGFPEGGAELMHWEVRISTNENVKLDIAELPYGEYAIAVYHDINDNKKLDKNLFGIPTEPYGFSNNPKVKWQAPKLPEALFDFQPEKNKLEIELQRWKNH